MAPEKPLFITVEGPIGVGKTTLTHLISERLSARVLLEVVEENPFLADFYSDRDRYAFQTQLFFLLSRYKQQADVLQGDLFAPGGVVSDYILDKDRLFATMNLVGQELALYNNLWNILSPQAPKPDLVILLMAQVEVLLGRIVKRGRVFEEQFDRAYLEELVETYSEYFNEYSAAPLLVIDSSEIDFVHDEREQDHLIAVIREHQGGTEYYKPLGS
jgi:deoxyadenosine/deoxycytidine kinase